MARKVGKEEGGSLLRPWLFSPWKEHCPLSIDSIVYFIQITHRQRERARASCGGGESLYDWPSPPLLLIKPRASNIKRERGISSADFQRQQQSPPPSPRRLTLLRRAPQSDIAAETLIRAFAFQRLLPLCTYARACVCTSVCAFKKAPSWRSAERDARNWLITIKVPRALARALYGIKLQAAERVLLSFQRGQAAYVRGLPYRSGFSSFFSFLLFFMFLRDSPAPTK